MKSIITHARNVIERVKHENDNLNAAIAAMVGSLMSKTKEDFVDLENEQIFVDSDAPKFFPNTMDERVLLRIEYDESGTLCYVENENDDEQVDLDSLPFNTRIELAEKLADILKASQRKSILIVPYNTSALTQSHTGVPVFNEG